MPIRRALDAVPAETGLVVALVSGSHVVNHTYLVLLPPLVGVLAGEFGVSVGAIGLAMGAVGLTNTTFQLPFGYLSDGYSRTLTFALSLAFGTAGAAVIALAPSFEGLVVGQLLVGVGVAGHHPAHYPLLADAVSARGDLGQNFAVITVGIMLGGAVAPPAFGAVIDRAGAQAAFVAIAAIAAFATLLTAAVLRTYWSELDGRRATATGDD